MKKTILAAVLASASVWAAAVEPAKVTKYSNVPAGAFGNASRTTGTVELQLDIDADGTLKATRVVKGRPDFVNAAVQTVRGWRFAPATVDGRGVKSKFNVIVAFDFDNRS
jgi:TonB family protein